MVDSANPVKIVEINLFETILESLKGRQVLQKAFDLEATKGSAALSKTLSLLVRPAQVVDYIHKKLNLDEQLVMLTGIGAS